MNAAIVREGTCLVAQRGPGMSFSDKWELPGGKVEPGEGPREALRREVKEELGVEVDIGPLIAHAESHPGARTFQVDIYAAELSQGTPRAGEHAQHRWCDPGKLDDLDWVEPHRPLLAAVKTYLDRKRRAALDPFDPVAIVERSFRVSETAMEWVAASMTWTMIAYGTWSAIVSAGLRAQGTYPRAAPQT